MSYLSCSRDFQGVGDILYVLLENVMSTESELSKAQKEMIALYSSRLNDCHYCVSSHSSVLASLATDEEFVRSLANGSTGPLDDKLRAVFRFAHKLTLEPGNISEADTDAMRSAGCSDQTIEDTICVVSTFAFLNRLVDGFGVAGSGDHFEQVGGMVAGQGYQPLIKKMQQKTGVAS